MSESTTSGTRSKKVKKQPAATVSVKQELSAAGGCADWMERLAALTALFRSLWLHNHVEKMLSVPWAVHPRSTREVLQRFVYFARYVHSSLVVAASSEEFPTSPALQALHEETQTGLQSFFDRLQVRCHLSSPRVRHDDAWIRTAMA